MAQNDGALLLGGELSEIRAVTVHSQTNIDVPGFFVTEVGLVVSGDPIYEEWELCGKRLSLIEHAIHWALGDWLNYGEARWGEMYTQAVDETGFSYDTLSHDKWLASEFELWRRRHNLSWSHHREVAPLPEDEREKWLDIALEEKLSRNQLRKRIREDKRQRQEQAGLDSLPADLEDRFTLICGDMVTEMEALAPGSIDVIITDPPYPQEYLYLYGELARLARVVLKPGGSLLAMAGQSYLPDLFKLMTPHLTYNWTLSYLTPGGQSPQLWTRKVNTFWKPILWFVRGEYAKRWQGDVIKSDVNDNDKRFHHWGQSESGMARLVERFSIPGDKVLDPFCGGGTTGVVALSLNRQFIGIDISEDAIQKTRTRICQRKLDKSGQDGVIKD